MNILQSHNWGDLDKDILIIYDFGVVESLDNIKLQPAIFPLSIKTRHSFSRITSRAMQRTLL